MLGIEQRKEPFNESCKVDNTGAVVEKFPIPSGWGRVRGRGNEVGQDGLTQDKIGNTGDSDLTRVEDPEEN